MRVVIVMTSITLSISSCGNPGSEHLSDAAECSTQEVSLGNVDVDFGGHASISGPVHVVGCRVDVQSISPVDVRKLHTEFEAFVVENYLAAAFSCMSGFEKYPHLVEVRDDALRRLNAVLGRDVLLDLGCGLNLSEAI